MSSRYTHLIGTLSLGMFFVVFLGVVFCSNLHLTIPMSGIRQVMGCELSVDEHQDVMMAITGIPASSLLGMIFAISVIAVFVAIVRYVPTFQLLSHSRYVQRNSERRDRLLESFRRGIINPKLYPVS